METDKQKKAWEAALGPHQEVASGVSLVVQWLGLATFTAVDPDSIPDWGTKIPQAAQFSQKKERMASSFGLLARGMHRQPQGAAAGTTGPAASEGLHSHEQC